MIDPDCFLWRLASAEHKSLLSHNLSMVTFTQPSLFLLSPDLAQEAVLLNSSVLTPQ